MFKRKTTATEGLAESEGGARDFSCDAECLSKATDPFRFSGTERAMQTQDGARRKKGEVASSVSPSGGRIGTDFVRGKISGGDHSLGGEAHPCDSPDGWEDRIQSV